MLGALPILQKLKLWQGAVSDYTNIRKTAERHDPISPLYFVYKFTDDK